MIIIKTQWPLVTISIAISKCNRTSITSVQMVKYLGVTIDANLKWKNYIKIILER